MILAELSGMTKDELDSVETLEKTANAAMRMDSVVGNALATTLILDGLDECTRKERKPILAWIANIIRSSMNEPGRHSLRILVSSQDVEDIQAKLSGDLYLSLEDMAVHRSEINRYTDRKLDKLQQKFRLSQEVVESIEGLTLDSAEGKLLSRCPCFQIKN